MKVNGKARVIAIGIILVVLIMVVFGSIKQYNSWRLVRQEIDSRGKLIAQLESKWSSLEDIKQETITLEKQLSLLQKAFPLEPSREELLLSIHEAASTPTSSVTETRFQEDKSVDNHLELPVNIAFEGPYRELVEFLGDLQSSTRAFRIDSLKITKGKDRPFQLRAELLVNGFARQKNPAN